jgi:dynein heavy chain
MTPVDAAEALKKYQRYFETYERKWNTYSEGEEMFALYITEYPELEQTKKELGLLEKLYSLYTETSTTITGYADILWSDVVANIESMNEEVGKLQTRCKTMPKALRDWDAYNELKRKIDDFLEVLPLLTALSGKAMQDRHWKQIQTLTGSTLDMNPETFKLAALLDIGSKPGETSLLAVAEEVEDICGGSSKELQIENKLKSLAETWEQLKFSFNNFKNRGPVILSPKELGEIMEALEESQMALGSMSSNRYSAPFREDLQYWLASLSTVSDVVDQWVQVQNLWIYMEAVFSSGDIAKQLPQEAKRFSGIDKNFMKVTAKALENPLVCLFILLVEYIFSYVRHILQCVECCCNNDIMKELLPHLVIGVCFEDWIMLQWFFMLIIFADGATRIVPKVTHRIFGDKKELLPSILLLFRQCTFISAVPRI